MSCSVAGCHKPLYAKGLCNMHYARVLRNGAIDRVRPTRIKCDLNRIVLQGDTARLYLSERRYALIDTEDVLRVRQFKWSLTSRRRKTYAQARLAPSRGGDGRTVLLHAFLVPLVSDTRDHINGDGLDNRKCNLRPATFVENGRNRHSRKAKVTSKYCGVSWFSGRRTWRVQITYNNRNRFIGYFDNEEDAAVAFNVAAQILHGAFASQNLVK